jgi:porphobilinogen deaminase
VATVAGDTVRRAAVVAAPDGSRIVRAESEAATPEGVAEAASTELLAGGAGEILARVRP